MPESSDPPIPENPTDAASAKPSAGAARVPIAPRVNPPSINDAPAQPPPVLGPNFNLNDLVNLAKNFSDPQAQAPANRSLIRKEQKKFSRQENKPKSPETVEGAAPETVETDPASETSAPIGSEDEASAVAPAPTSPVARHGGGQPGAAVRPRTSASSSKNRPQTVPLTHTRHAHRGTGTRFSPLPFLIGQAVLILLVFLGWLAWRAAHPAPSPRTTRPTITTAADGESEVTIATPILDLIDQMAVAEKTGDARKALALCERIRAANSRIPHLDYKQAQLAMMAGDNNKAMLALNRAAEAGEDLSEGHILRASVLIQQGKMAPAAREYELAAQAAPFTAKPFFYWGECLRRLGKPQAALDRLKQAEDRARDAGEEALYQLKTRLTLIELNREQEFADALKTELARTPPSPEWLMTAAAQELHRGNYNAAASYLDQTSKFIPASLLSVWLRDYFLFNFAHQKELDRFYGPILAAAAAAMTPPAPVSNPSPGPKPEGETPNFPSPSDSPRQDAISLAPPSNLPPAPLSLSPAVSPSPSNKK